MIDKVVIATYKKDFWLAEICMASIRYYYPSMPIAIVFDFSFGSTNFDFAKNNFQIEIIDLPIKKFGWGLSKIEYLFQNKKERVLVLDADTVLIGYVLDYLSEYIQDFVVSADYHIEPLAAWMNECYFNYSLLKKYAPDFSFPGYNFNTGQFIATTGILKRIDFDGVIKWQEYPQIKQPDIFACADQGVLNFILPKLEAVNKISIGKANFLIGINYPKVKELQVSDLKRETAKYPAVLHWAGSNTTSLRNMKRNDILRFYRNIGRSRFEIIILEIIDIFRYYCYQQTRLVKKLKQIFRVKKIS